MSKHRPTTVSILATPDTSASTLYGLFDVLNSVGVGWQTFVTGMSVEPQFDVRIVAAGRAPFRCAGNVLVSPHSGVEDVEDTDIALVASQVIPASTPPKDLDPRNFAWIVRQHGRGATMASACTGAVMLAEAGLLDSWEASSHWAYRDLFRIYYPKVRMRFDQDLCVSGSDNRIVTSGGTTAWQELALYLITRFRGAEHAAHTAKFWLIPNREENQAAFSAMAQGIPHDDGVVNECQAWIAGHYEHPNPISGMAERSGLSPTTFARRFNRATGYRPMDYVHALRVEEAKEMLETGDDAIDKIGREVGYEDPASFRRIFKRKVGLTPSIYRRKFSRSRFERFEGMGVARM
jgi:transcriptional regulator GlxA family with amidase domain